MIPVSSVLTRVRTRYEAEAGGSDVRWTDTSLLLFINEGMENLAETTSFYERYVSIPLEGGRTYYDLRGFTPETVVTITSVWSTNRTQWLDPISSLTLDVNWPTATGSPLAYWTAGIFWLGVYPFPTETDDTTGYLRVHFKGIPTRFVNTQGVLRDLPDHFYPALEDYVLYEMAAADGNAQRALAHWASYQQREAALSRFVDHRLETAHHGRLGGMAGRI
jgi:hypothetical protein